jgi:hypothetical protein
LLSRDNLFLMHSLLEQIHLPFQLPTFQTMYFCKEDISQNKKARTYKCLGYQAVLAPCFMGKYSYIFYLPHDIY